MPFKAAGAVCVLLYLAGLFGDSYYGLIGEKTFVYTIYQGLFHIFEFSGTVLQQGGEQEIHHGKQKKVHAVVALCFHELEQNSFTQKKAKGDAQIFLDGTFYHLWYLPALLLGFALLLLLLRALPFKAAGAVCVLLYLAGLFGDRTKYPVTMKKKGTAVRARTLVRM